jgi:AAA ATPase domain
MATRLGDLLDDARRRTFVGRRRELASFDDVLLGRSARRVLLVHGPGGIGKTTLLQEYRTRARAAGRTVLLLDAREVDPSPEGFEDAMAAPWRSDPGWRSVVGVHRLGDLDEAESAELLERAGVAPTARPQLVRLGRGHPLAMALLADIAVTGTVPDRLAEVPDLVAALLESLLRGAPADVHMTGLAACAMAWLTTEDLLRRGRSS